MTEVTEIKEELPEEDPQKCRICSSTYGQMIDIYNPDYPENLNSSSDFIEHTFGISSVDESRLTCSVCFNRLTAFFLFRRQAEESYRRFIAEQINDPEFKSHENNRTAYMCRICLNSSRELINIFKSFIKTTETKSNSYCEIFKEVTGLSLTEEDGFPQSICNTCARNLAEFSVFCHQGTLTSQNVDIYTITFKKEIDEMGNEVQNDLTIEPLQLAETRLTTETIRNKQITKNDKGEFVCTICSKTFTKQHCWRKHVRDHTEGRKHSCEICFKKFIRPAHVKAHMLVHNEDRSHVCKVCSKSFRCDIDLITHMRVHNNDRPFKCPICSKTYTRLKVLNFHMRSHKNENVPKCDICLKIFRSPEGLERHLPVHSVERRYQCEICFRRFIKSSALKAHIFIHTQERPFECKICSKSFNRSSTLNAHIRVHTNDRPHECSICGKRFMLPNRLYRHMRVHEN